MKWTWLPRSSTLTPFFVAITGSPSKYAARCSNSVKSSTVFSARCEPNSRCTFTPRSDRRVDAVPELLRPYVSHQVSGAVGVAVGVAIEAGDAAARMLAAAILRLVELLLRKRRQQQAEAFDLLRVEQAVKELIVVVDRDQLPLRDVTQIGTRGQEHGRWKFGQEMVWNIAVQVEACKIALLLLVDLIDFELRERPFRLPDGSGEGAEESRRERCRGF